MDAVQPAARAVIARELEAYLRGTRIRTVHFARAGVAPPPLAYVTSFPRLSVPLTGKHSMELAHHERPTRIVLARGHVLFVGRNCWNRPDWARPVKVLTFLFGKKQIGISLVRHEGRQGDPVAALKTTLGSVDGMTQNILSALVALAEQRQTSPLDRLLIEALLQSCLQLLTRPAAPHSRKAARTFEAICLYIQENFQRALTRESVARNFDLAPNHVSRLFRREGCMRFSDYVTLVRIDRAKFMLKEYGSPLKEVAANCGYRHVAYFCRVFRRITKVTPTDYRLKGL